MIPLAIDFYFYAIVVKEDIQYNFNLFEFAKICFVEEHMVYTLENVSCVFEKKVNLLLLDRMFCVCLLGPFGL